VEVWKREEGWWVSEIRRGYKSARGNDCEKTNTVGGSFVHQKAPAIRTVSEAIAAYKALGAFPSKKPGIFKLRSMEDRCLGVCWVNSNLSYNFT